MLLDNTKGSCDAIRGSGNDAAGIARTFTDRIEASEIFRFTQGIAADPDRGGGTGFRTGQHSVRGRETGKLGVHGADAQLQVLGNPARKHGPQVRRNDAGTIGGDNFPESGGSPVLQEIANPLRRGSEVPAAGTESSFFDAALQHKPGEGMIVSEVLRTDAHQQG